MGHGIWGPGFPPNCPTYQPTYLPHHQTSYFHTPAPPGHFLQEFGQSDREIIENSNRQASVPQALTLLNGVIYGAVFSPQSPLSKNLSRVNSEEEKIKVLFLSLLNREASKSEIDDCLEIVKRKSSLPPPSLKIPDHWPKEKKVKYRKAMDKRMQTVPVCKQLSAHRPGFPVVPKKT